MAKDVNGEEIGVGCIVVGIRDAAAMRWTVTGIHEDTDGAAVVSVRKNGLRVDTSPDMIRVVAGAARAAGT